MQLFYWKNDENDSGYDLIQYAIFLNNLIKEYILLNVRTKFKKMSLKQAILIKSRHFPEKTTKKNIV